MNSEPTQVRVFIILALMLALSCVQIRADDQRIDELIKKLETGDVLRIYVKDESGFMHSEIVEKDDVEVELLNYGPVIIPYLLESLKRQDIYKLGRTYVIYHEMIGSFGEKAEPYLLAALEEIEKSPKRYDPDKYFDYFSSIFICFRVCEIKPTNSLIKRIRQLGMISSGRLNPSAKELLEYWENIKSKK